MNESLVQWTLLNNQKKLANFLGFDFSTVLGQEISTDFGRIDFVVKNNSEKSLVVELETVINSKNKRDYCFNQILNYQNVQFTPDTEYCLLYAQETPEKYTQEIKEFGEKNSVIIKRYSISKVVKLYDETIKSLSLNVGLALPMPKNYTICYLRWLNKILMPFQQHKIIKLNFAQIFKPFENTQNSKTNFNCHLQLAHDFEMLEIKNNYYFLTKTGEEYIDNSNINFDKKVKISTIDLTLKRTRLNLNFKYL